MTYVPGWTEENGPFSAYDQVLIGYSAGSWRVFSEQYVPIAAALAQHKGRILGQPGGPGLIAIREAGALPGPASRGIGRAESRRHRVAHLLRLRCCDAAAATARRSTRSLKGSELWPFTHLNCKRPGASR